MRYGKERKRETRRRIIQTAGRRFKRDGIDGSGIATLMSDAGLTNGAFYAHFASKEDLVATTVADQLRAQRASFSALAPGHAGVEQYVVGTLQLSRVLADQQLADQVLEEGIQNALVLLGAEHQT